MLYYGLAVFSGIIIDVVTGVIFAVLTKSLNSTKMRQGGMHKIAEVIAVIFSAYAEHSMDMLNINVGFSIFKLVCAYLIIMECISIIENLGKMNPNVFPKKISKFFEKIRKEIDVEWRFIVALAYMLAS